jgi:hypothetical protein
MRKIAATLLLVGTLGAAPPALAQADGPLFCFANDAAMLYRAKIRVTPPGGTESNPPWRNVTAGTRHCVRVAVGSRVRIEAQVNDGRWLSISSCDRTFVAGNGAIVRATGSGFGTSCTVQ